MVGRTISHFEILEKLGEGGMGVVFCARDLRLDRLVAVKILPAEQMLDVRRRGRFEREAKAASALNHPNIITIHEIESVDGVDYIAMEYVRGSTLRELIPPGGMDLKDALNYANQIAAGLAAAHAAGIVHRDIKPANIMVTKPGLVKILDFGLAQVEAVPSSESDSTGTIAPLHLTKPGTVLGTAAYMSPEQAQGQEMDQRSDIFSFGIVLYQMLTGALPFQSNSELGLMFEIVHGPTPSASGVRRDLPPALDRVLATALQKNPKLRYPDMQSLVADLRQVSREVEKGVEPTAFIAGRAWRARPRWRRPLEIGVFAISLLLLAAVLAWKIAPRWMARVPVEKKIAVLPFRNVGDNRENEAFRDGLMEALTSELTELSQFHNSLWVVPATEVRREGLTSAKDAQRQLGVNLVISGSVQRDASHIFLTANLVDAQSLRQLHAREITRPIEDFADMQQAVVQEVAGMLQLELGAKDREKLAAGGTNTSSAYDFYLQGRGHLQRRNKAEVDKAIDIFKQSVQQDPKYALAFAGLSEAYWWKYRFTADTQWVALAQANSKKALELNDQLAPVYVTRGIIEEGAGNHEEAVKALERALDLEPINGSAGRELAAVYEATGKLPESESTLKKGVALRPSDWTSLYDLGMFYYRQGRYPEAVPLLQRVTDLAPDNNSGYTGLGAVFWMQGKYDNAIASFKRSLELRQTASAYTSLGTIYFFMGRCSDAVEQMQKAVELVPTRDQFWGNLGDAYACVPGKNGASAQSYKRAIDLGKAVLAVNPKEASVLGRLALYHARLGNKPEADAQIKQARLIAPASRDILWNAVLVYELAGQRDQALDALKAAIQAGQPLEEVRREPALENLRKDPRYARLVASR
jgi:serine/threonine protein kinase/tetratricopeptide (TPR) repeat protein